MTFKKWLLAAFIVGAAYLSYLLPSTADLLWFPVDAITLDFAESMALSTLIIIILCNAFPCRMTIELAVIEYIALIITSLSWFYDATNGAGGLILAAIYFNEAIFIDALLATQIIILIQGAPWHGIRNGATALFLRIFKRMGLGNLCSTVFNHRNCHNYWRHPKGGKP